MVSVTFACRAAFATSIVLASLSNIGAVRAESDFPFGMEMMLEAARQPGSKRIPDLDIGDNGEVVLELWCKGGKGQFSVAGGFGDLCRRSDGGPRLPAGPRATG